MAGLIKPLTQASFTLFLVLSLTTPSWRYGPFSWFPLWQGEEVAGAPVTIGAFNLLPLFLVTSLLVDRLAGDKWRRWQWGRWGITLPFLGLTLLGLLSLDLLSPRRMFIHAGGLAIAWLVYLVILNERPSLTLPLSLVLMIQGGVALAQFSVQREVGLAGLGELPLNPGWQGITVLFARDTRWLRAYGLTAHPNLLGALLAVLLLLLWPAYGRLRGWRQAAVGMALAAGCAGLFVSFSRAAWLGFSAGMLAWGFWTVKRRQSHAISAPCSLRFLWPFIPSLLLFLAYNDLALSRFADLDSPIEARSLDERSVDAGIALQLIGDHPWRGVGLGNYTGYAQAIAPDANRVHNAPLLVTAELGLPGGLLWLLLALFPFFITLPSRRPAAPSSCRSFTPYQLGLWLAMLLMSQFDTMVWVSSNWQTAVLFALMAVQMAREMTAYELSGKPAAAA